jgi:hypothetical protein
MKSETMERCLAGEAVVSRADRLTYLLLTTLYLVIVILLLSTRKSAASLLAGPTVSLSHHGLASEATLHEASPTLSLICVYLRPSAVKAFRVHSRSFFCLTPNR